MPILTQSATREDVYFLNVSELTDDELSDGEQAEVVLLMTAQVRKLKAVLDSLDI